MQNSGCTTNAHTKKKHHTASWTHRKASFCSSGSSAWKVAWASNSLLLLALASLEEMLEERFCETWGYEVPLKILQLKHLQFQLHRRCSLTLQSFKFKCGVSVSDPQPNAAECALAIQIASSVLQLKLVPGRQNTIWKKQLMSSNWLKLFGFLWQSPGSNTKRRTMQSILAYIEKLANRSGTFV